MPDHVSAAGGPLDLAGVVAALALLLAAFTYLGAAARLRRRGDRWPQGRQYAFVAGAVALAAVATVPPPGAEFTAHMTQHLIIGMVAPLLLVLGRPVTLALRTVPAGPSRTRLLKVMHSRAVAVLVFPPLAAAIEAGGLWALYRTRLFAIIHGEPWWPAAVHAHILTAGILFTASVCQLEPVRRRYPTVLRTGSLLAAATAHAVLAKTLWVAPPPGTLYGSIDAHNGAELMYYGGDAIEIALAVVVAATWYSTSGRALARAQRRCVHSGGRCLPDVLKG
jgi:putative membrane protein